MESFDSGEGFVRLGKSAPEALPEYVDEPAQLPGPSTFGQVLDQGIDVLRDNFLLLSTASGALTFATTFAMRAAYFAGPDSEEEMPQLLWMSLVMLALTSLLGSMLIGLAAMLAIADHQPEHARRTGLAALRGARFGRGLVTSLLVGVIVAAALVLIFPLGFYFGYRLTYATTAACYEARMPFGALARSWRLTRGADRFGEWLGLFACVVFLSSIPLSLASALSEATFADSLGELFGMNLSSMSYVLEPMSAYLMGLGTALGAVVFGRFQLDLLARRDGLDLRRRLAARFHVELTR